MLNVTQSRRDAKKGTSQKSPRLCVSALRQVFWVLLCTLQPYLSFGYNTVFPTACFFSASWRLCVKIGERHRVGCEGSRLIHL